MLPVTAYLAGTSMKLNDIRAMKDSGQADTEKTELQGRVTK